MNFFSKLYKTLIEPITKSKRSPEEISIAVAIGLFVAFTPTVGVQMYIVWLLWYPIKVLFKFNFDVVIATALVWLSNPVTIVPFYYTFYITGLAVFNPSEIENNNSDMFASFKDRFDAITNSDLTYFQAIGEFFNLLWFELGVPMVFGSFFYAIPFSILGYFGTKIYFKRKNKKKQQDV